MAHLAIDGVKRRLTERTDLAVAVKFLMAHGFADDQIGVQLSRHYYVDIDGAERCCRVPVTTPNRGHRRRRRPV
jgi:hypothetical protein